jgi:hypothetical protein
MSLNRVVQIRLVSVVHGIKGLRLLHKKSFDYFS